MERFVVILLAVLLVVSFATNPGYDDFEQALRYDIEQSVGARGGLAVAAVGFAVDVVGLQRFITYRDYGFFSVYDVKFPGCEGERYLGMFGGFRRIY